MNTGRTSRQRIVLVATVCGLLFFIGMVAGLLINNMVIIAIGVGGAVISGSVGMLAFSPYSFFTLAVLISPFLCAVTAESRGYHIVNIWWFWLLTAMSVGVGSGLILKAISKHPKANE